MSFCEVRRKRTFSIAGDELVELKYSHLWRMVKIEPVCNFSAMIVNRRRVGDMTFVAIGGVQVTQSGAEPYIFEVPEKFLMVNAGEHLVAAFYNNLAACSLIYPDQRSALRVHLKQQAEEMVIQTLEVA